MCLTQFGRRERKAHVHDQDITSDFRSLTSSVRRFLRIYYNYQWFIFVNYYSCLVFVLNELYIQMAVDDIMKHLNFTFGPNNTKHALAEHFRLLIIKYFAWYTKLYSGLYQSWYHQFGQSVFKLPYLEDVMETWTLDMILSSSFCSLQNFRLLQIWRFWPSAYNVIGLDKWFTEISQILTRSVSVSLYSQLSG